MHQNESYTAVEIWNDQTGEWINVAEFQDLVEATENIISRQKNERKERGESSLFRTVTVRTRLYPRIIG